MIGVKCSSRLLRSLRDDQQVERGLRRCIGRTDSARALAEALVNSGISSLKRLPDGRPLRLSMAVMAPVDPNFIPEPERATRIVGLKNKILQLERVERGFVGLRPMLSAG